MHLLLPGVALSGCHSLTLPEPSTEAHNVRGGVNLDVCVRVLGAAAVLDLGLN